NSTPCMLGTDCLLGFCVDGVCCDSACAAPCDACNLSGSAGACRPLAQGTAPDAGCSGFACDGADAGCPAGCSTARDCIAGFFCGAGQCVPAQPAGAPCNGPEECDAGSCAQGVCCGSACNGPCEACNLTGS